MMVATVGGWAGIASSIRLPFSQENAVPPVRQLNKPVASRHVEDEFAHWTNGKFRCRCPGCGGREYSARVYGPWVVFLHEELDWELIHVKTNLSAVTGMKSAEDCFSVGDYLQRKFPLVLRLGTVDEMREKMGEVYTAVNQWTKRCKYWNKFVPPTF